jgi:cyclopropane fatty-acyl-phospholipid synthase-like methyltransferase
VLRAVLPASAEVLEIGAGTGQHADYFTARMQGWRWWPTTAPAEFATLEAGLAGIHRDRLAAPAALDVFGAWPEREFDAVVTANTAHILSEAGVRALFRGAASVLAPGGRLVLYGPFRRGGEHTAPSNAQFDDQLRARDSSMGIRDLAEIDRWATEAGLGRVAELEMPANNLTLIFEYEPDARES